MGRSSITGGVLQLLAVASSQNKVTAVLAFALIGVGKILPVVLFPIKDVAVSTVDMVVKVLAFMIPKLPVPTEGATAKPESASVQASLKATVPAAQVPPLPAVFETIMPVIK
jgi:hypothetical protein